MAAAAEGDWSLEVTLRGTTFGTEAQARETADRWRRLVAVAAGSDIELVGVDVVAVASVIEPRSDWVGTIAFENVETTDGRVIERLSWSRLAASPLPVVMWGTGELVGTVTEVWREALGPNGGPVLEPGTPLPALVEAGERTTTVAIRARGALLDRVIADLGGRVPLGMDVTAGDSTQDGDRFVLSEAELLGITLYPDGSGQHGAWPDCALELVEDP